MFSKSKIFSIGCLIFILGIGLASFLPVNFLQSKIWWFSAAVVFLILTILFWPEPGLNLKSVSLYFLFLGILFFSVWRYSISLPASTPDKIWFYLAREP